MIAVLGGSFDPIHLGHLAAAEYLCKNFLIEKFYFMPCARHAFNKNFNANDTQRVDMLQLAIEGNKKFSIDTRELTKKSNPSYTIESLSEIRQEIGANTPLIFILGQDAFSDLDKWHQGFLLTNFAHLVVLQRTHNAHHYSAALEKFVETHTTKEKNKLSEQSHGLVYFADNPRIDLSSTEIRHNLKQYLKQLPQKVKDYIEKKGLYTQSI